MRTGLGRGGSPEAREHARRTMLKWHREQREDAAKCGAHARSTGEPCRQIAMSNGRCCYHGGRTPKGDRWHVPQWPKASAPDFEKRFARKIADRQKAASEREARVARMSPEERASYEAGRRARPPGHAAARRQARERRKQNAEARALLEHAEQTPDAEGQALADRIAELRKLAAALEAQRLTGGIFD